MVDTGYHLRALVNGMMVPDWHQSDDFADVLRTYGYSGRAGKYALKELPSLFDGLSADNKTQIRSKLLQYQHLLPHLQGAGMWERVVYFCLGISQENVAVVVAECEALVLHLMLMRPPKTFHFGAFGEPGVGKSTGWLASLQSIVYNAVCAGNNKALAKLLARQRELSAGQHSRLTQFSQTSTTPTTPTHTIVYVAMDSNLSGSELQKVVRPQMQGPDLYREGADLTDLVRFVVIDEVDQIALVKPKQKKDNLVGKMLDLAEGNFGGRGWKESEDDDNHHVYIICWIGNFTPVSARLGEIQQRQSVVGQLKDALGSGKFTAERLCSALNSIVLT